MIMKGLASRDSMLKAAAAAGYLSVIAIAIMFTWNTASTLEEQRATVAAAETMLAQIEQRSSNAHQVDTSGAGGGATGSPFLEGSTLSVAEAALLQRVASVIHRVGGNVLSSQVDLDGERAKAGWVGLLVSCDLDQPSLQLLLYDVEAGTPSLFIDQLVVQEPTAGVKGGRMHVLMSVSGQWWSGK
jgi:general secretion pathway protein M